MKRLVLACAMIMFAAPAAAAEDLPEWLKSTYPSEAAAPGFEEHAAVYGEGDLSRKTKQLIALGVAAQIPCDYCVVYHTEMAEQAGASSAEIKEAIASAAMVRKWSTVLNGNNYDMSAFKEEAGIAGE
jgi:AhpD family alkylhydroperoxidase